MRRLFSGDRVLFTVAFVCCLAIAAFVYRRSQTQFLRAESGMYLRIAHSDEAAQRQLIGTFFTASYGGHYTPLAFLTEFQLSKWAGTHRAFWRWRQIAAVALVAALGITAVQALARGAGASRGDAIAIGAALSALAALQPAMLDFVCWPFMIMQLLWLALLLLSLYALARMVNDIEAPRWPILAAISAYASMHVTGLGVATTAAVGVVLAWVLALAKRNALSASGTARRRIARVLVALMIFAGAHSVAMIALLPPAQPDNAVRTISWLAAAKLALGFAFNFPFAGLRALSLTFASDPTIMGIVYCWPAGVLLVVAIVLAGYRACRLRTELSPATATGVAAALFAGTAFIVLVGMIIVRALTEAPAAQRPSLFFFNVFTVLPRYVIPMTYILLPPLAVCAGFFARRWRSCIGVCTGVIIAAVATQHAFVRGPHAALMPSTRVSHYTIWRMLLATARECRAANLPLPNLPLGALTQEFTDADVRSFAPLLRADLHLSSDDALPIADLDDVKTTDDARVPSLPGLKHKLGMSD